MDRGIRIGWMKRIERIVHWAGWPSTQWRLRKGVARADGSRRREQFSSVSRARREELSRLMERSAESVSSGRSAYPDNGLPGIELWPAVDSFLRSCAPPARPRSDIDPPSGLLRSAAACGGGRSAPAMAVTNARVGAPEAIVLCRQTNGAESRGGRVASRPRPR